MAAFKLEHTNHGLKLGLDGRELLPAAAVKAINALPVVEHVTTGHGENDYFIGLTKRARLTRQYRSDAETAISQILRAHLS